MCATLCRPHSKTWPHSSLGLCGGLKARMTAAISTNSVLLIHTGRALSQFSQDVPRIPTGLSEGLPLKHPRMLHHLHVMHHSWRATTLHLLLAISLCCNIAGTWRWDCQFLVL